MSTISLRKLILSRGAANPERNWVPNRS